MVKNKKIIDVINDTISKIKNKGKISDGSHTFDELYDHRSTLFSVILNAEKNNHLAWKSKLHEDGTMFPDYFVVGIETSEGQFSYHYQLEDWDDFKVKELEHAPKWDGHEAKDVTRLKSL